MNIMSGVPQQDDGNVATTHRSADGLLISLELKQCLRTWDSLLETRSRLLSDELRIANGDECGRFGGSGD
jgi:hypothetical protein